MGPSNGGAGASSAAPGWPPVVLNLACSLGERLSHVKDHLKVTGVERPTGLSEAWDTDLLGQFPSVLAKVLVGVDPADPKLPQPPQQRE